MIAELVLRTIITLCNTDVDVLDKEYDKKVINCTYNKVVSFNKEMSNVQKNLRLRKDILNENER